MASGPLCYQKYQQQNRFKQARRPDKGTKLLMGNVTILTDMASPNLYTIYKLYNQSI